MDIVRSDIVVSLAGRDRGKLFIVLDTEGEFVYLTDGRLRKTEKPKRKKCKHVRFASSSDSHAAMKIKDGEQATNSEVRRALNEYAAKAGGF